MNKGSSGISLILSAGKAFPQEGELRDTVAFRKHLFTVPFPWNGLPSAHLCGKSPPSLLLYESFPFPKRRPVLFIP